METTIRKYHYSVSAEYHLTIAEVQKILAHSSSHYDRSCRGAGQVGGFIYGWHNMVLFSGGAASVFVTIDQADMVCKIMESERPADTYNAFHTLFDDLTNEHKRIN